MPYRTLVFVKVQLKVLREYRFTDQLTDDGKLLFFLLISLAGITENQIPNRPVWISRFFNLSMPENRVCEAIKNVSSVFPKLIVTKELISWENFEEIHNYVYGKTQGKPEENPGFAKNKKENKKENIQVVKKPPPESFKVIAYFKEKALKELNLAYAVTKKDYGLIKNVIKELGADEVKRRIDLFFESKDEFILKAGRTVGIFVNQINKLRDREEQCQKPRAY